MDALRPEDPVSVGAYQLVSRIGAGGMGRVYLGVSPGGRKVAVKLIQPDFASTPEFRERFAREVEAARRVGGFHTAQVVDADPFADPPWMVTAYIPGLSLESAISSSGPLGLDEIRALGAGLAEGLAAIHACGLVHRDVKPSNVILGDDGPRIIDFGIARMVGASTMTASGSVLGTIAYMSPEQVNGESAGPASDVFSLASTLAFAATGHSPFSGETIAAVIHRIATEPPDLTGLPGDAGFRQLIAECLAKNPADRPSLAEILAGLSPTSGHAAASRQPTAADASAAAADASHPRTLEPVLAGTPTVTVDGPDQRSPRPAPPVPDSGVRQRRRVRHPRAVAAAAAAVVLAAAGVAIALNTGTPHSPRTSGHPLLLASMPVTATSALPPVTGDRYVEYRGGQDANAKISGTIKDATNGQVVRLYAQQFPYTSAPASVGAFTLQPVARTATYAFEVTPTLATRYQVMLFRTSTATTPLARSAATTIYVTITADRVGRPTCRTYPICHLTETHVFYVPPAELKPEMNKQWYAYLGVNLSSGSKEPPLPTWLQLGAGAPVISPPQLISAGEFSVTITYTFNIGNGSWHFHSTLCSKNTEAQDGIGLPGSHGCGSERISGSYVYLG